MSVNWETVEAMKAKLREVRDLGTPVKADLYSHLIEVFNRILLHHRDDGYDKFEEISSMVKHTNFKIQDPELDQVVNETSKVITNQQALDFIVQVEKLLKEEPDLKTKEEKAYVVSEPTARIENFNEFQDMLEWAGISFGEEMNCLIQKSIKRLAKLSGASYLRFFGKIFGSSADYWVVQGTLNQSEEAHTDPSQEVRGTGVNQTVYWVTNNIIGDWVQLPDVHPDHINISRLIKHNFSGDLNASISSFPPFPGKERNLLRATLARIQHATQLCPQGTYEIDEETNEQKLAEEAPSMATEDLKSLEKWSHLFPIILQAGRCSHAEPTHIPEEEREEYMNKLAEDDPSADRFRVIAEDTPVPNQKGAWLSKTCGDNQVFNRVGGEGTSCYAVNVIQSLRWPGAVTVAKGGLFCNLYIGSGMKRGDDSFIPTSPPDVNSDPQEQEEQWEPQGVEKEDKPAEEAPEEDE